MNKSILLGSALAVALSAPAMAADFQALADLQGAAPTPLTDVVLAATEGGACVAGGAEASGVITGCSVNNIGNAAAGSIDGLPPGIAVGFAALGVTMPF